jgi:4'-phosphopantetheinyl transferase
VTAQSTGDVTVWHARLADWAPELETLLDERERSRLERFRRTQDRRRFAVAAALVRQVVGGYAGLAPSSVVIDRECDACGRPHGRPRAPQVDDLGLSVSHGGDHVLVAAVIGSAVGVDVQPITGVRIYEELLTATLSHEEAARVRAVSERFRTQAFCVYWARKEAVLKALGVGLAIPPSDIVVTAWDAQPALVAPEVAELVGADLELRDLAVGGRSVAALAMLGRVGRVRLVDYSPSKGWMQ